MEADVVINELSGKNVDCVVNSDEATASSYRVKKLLALDFGYKFIACSRGCAFMVIYQAGVLKALKELSPEILKSASRIYGVSSGSIVAALAVCKCDMDEILPSFFSVLKNTNWLCLSSRMKVLHTLRSSLNKYLPTNAHQLVSGKLHIVLTRARDWQNVVISEFASKEDIIQAVFCSCFLPMYCGFFPPLYHGVRYIDGEFSMRQANFMSETTITVCSFAGEYDICPRENPAAFFAFQAFGYVLKISKNNIYRFLCALVPPTHQILDRFYCHGYQDTHSFLERLSEFGISYFAEDFVPAGQGIRSERQRGPVLEAINKDAAKENPVTCWAANRMEEEAQQRLLPQKVPAPQEKRDVPGQLSKSTESVLKSIR